MREFTLFFDAKQDNRQPPAAVILMVKKFRHTLLLLLSVFAVSPACAQFTYIEATEVEVRDQNSAVLSLPWAGGLNAAEYNTIDLDEDGKDDLVIFDKMSNSFSVFENTGTAYRHAPELAELLPAGVRNWALFADFNCDGRKDIFTADPLGIKVFVNHDDPNTIGPAPDWYQYQFTASNGSKTGVLLTKGFTTKVNLALQFDDLPALVDADNDGDFDIFNMRFGSGETVEFHRNLSKEKYGTCDSLDFERVTQTWGNFKECGCGSFAFNNGQCPEGGRLKHAGGKSLHAFDADGDQDVDLLFSEASCTNLYLLRNDGTMNAPNVQSSSTFPATDPVNLSRFPAAFREDVDFDGKKDLLVSTNLYANEDRNHDLRASSWRYRNTGTDAQPIFQLAEKGFLQNQMIDVGFNAVPAFLDLDNDGDEDMLVSSYAHTDGKSRIFHFENTGTRTVPEFQLNDEDFLGFSQLNFFNVKIYFTDINRDQRTDLAFSATDVTTGFTDLYFFANTSSAAFTPSATSQKLSFDLLSNENICFADGDGDGFVDILLGKGNGKLEFWKGNGQTYTLADDNFLNAPVNTTSVNLAAAAANLDGDGNADLVFADQNGKLFVIGNFRIESNRTMLQEEIIFNPLFNQYMAPNIGGRSWPVVVNLFGENAPAIVTGSVLGGVRIFKNDHGLSLPLAPQVEVYPNPVSKENRLLIKTDRGVRMGIFNHLGQRVQDDFPIAANEIFATDFKHLSAGIYMLRFFWGNTVVTRRVVVY